MSHKNYNLAMQGYDPKTYEQATQLLMVAEAIADGKTNKIKMFEDCGIIKPNGLLKKIETEKACREI